MQKILNHSHWDESSHLIKSSFRHGIRRNVSNDIYLLQNRLLSSPPNYLHLSLSEWAEKLRSSLQSMNEKNADWMAEIFDQSAVIFIGLEQFKSAREICYTQIKLYIQWGMTSGSSSLLKFVFKPWIRLIQINRLEGNMYDAFDQLNVLDFTHSSQIIGENKMLREKIYRSLSEDYLLKNIIITESLLERIKLCLESRQYEKLLAYFENNQNQFTAMQDFIIQEASAIAGANQGNTGEIYKILLQGHKNFSRDPILKLRELEMCLLSGVDNLVVDELVLLYESLLSLMNTGKIVGHDIIFMLHAAVIMQMAGLQEQAIKIVYFCLDASTKMGDEIFKAESLILLHDWIVDQSAKKNIQELMIAHYAGTQYAVVRRKMLNCFNDLKYINTTNSQREIEFLLEDLLEIGCDI